MPEFELTAATRKMVRGLAEAKNRRREGLFVAEGTKCVLDILPHFDCVFVAATPAWLGEHPDVIRKADIAKASKADLERMSSLSAPPPVIAVFRIPEDLIRLESLKGQLVLALDCVQDPGNLGTIMRVADWMGVHHILASSDTVDVYNPKAVQATMGSIARVKVHYLDLPAALKELRATGMPVYGMFLNGTDIYKSPLSSEGVIVMGNEGKGISAETAASVSHRLLIPRPQEGPGPESLNVAIATAITLAEFRRAENYPCHP